MPEIFRLIFNVPVTHSDIVRKAIGDAGAGAIGNYSHCSFSVKGVGRFTPAIGATPFLGEIGRPETVEEEQIQVDVPRTDMPDVLKALKEAHPYEDIGHVILATVPEDSF